MQKRSRNELDELSRAVAVRKIEIEEAKARSDLVETPVPKPSQALVSDSQRFWILKSMVISPAFVAIILCLRTQGSEPTCWSISSCSH